MISVTKNNVKIFRIALPLYLKTRKKLSRGKGYGKKKPVRKILYFLDLLFRSSEVEVHGHKMYLPKKGFLEYSTFGIYGEFDTSVVESIVQPGDHAIDIGAAIGYYILILARAVGKNGLVIAFEPKKERFPILKKNVEVNQYDNVILENKAILPKDTKPKFFSRVDGKAGLRFIIDSPKKYHYLDTYKFTVPAEQVSTIELDEYLQKNGLLEKISFMKIDVDGPEQLVLKSSDVLLNNKDLKILMEWDQESAKWSGCDPAAIIDLLIEKNFKIFYPHYKNRKYVQLNKNELLAMKSSDTINILCMKNSSFLADKGLLENKKTSTLLAEQR